MITNIHIENFKSLANITVPLKNLNLLTGINGMGKSTLIQVLLLLRQSYVPRMGRGVHLNGELTKNLGDFSDVLFKQALKEEIVFDIKTVSNQYVWQFSKGELNDILQGVLPQNINSSIPLFSDNKFQYIAAERITSNSRFYKSSEALAYKQFGASGEYAVHYLYEKGLEDALFSDDKDENGNSLPLINQVSYWLKNISPNVNLDINLISNTEYELRYKFAVQNNFHSYSAINSAFGLTISLPIITALLAAQPGDLLILENPESDLHPRAQSMIGQLMARAAAAGVQLIVETHSDHILNGICVAIHQGFLAHDLAKFFYFHKQDNEMASTVYDVKIMQNGQIDDIELRKMGIEGFFDQASKDLKSILFTPSKN